jgi:hypothetical protein
VVESVLNRVRSSLLAIYDRNDPKSFESAWGNVLLFLDRAAAGDFHGVVEIRIKGPVVLTMRTSEQTFVIANEYPNIYDAVTTSNKETTIGL